MERVLILGASNNPARYAYKAADMLLNHGHEILPVGKKNAEVFGHKIDTSFELHENIDTVTLYVGPRHHDRTMRDYILKIHPKRVIFNPGTENSEWMEELQKAGIQTEAACTLVLLSTGQYETSPA